MALKSINLFDLNLVNETTDNVLDKIFDSAGSSTIAFLNAHCINVATKDPNYRWALGKADFLLPDGSGIQMAAKIAGQKFVENLNGTDLFPKIAEAASQRNMKVFLFGSLPGVADAAADAAVKRTPQLKIAGIRNGFFIKSEEDEIIESINSSGAQVLLVALGVPAQEIWIARNRHRLTAKIVFGVGAQFDFWANRVSRAPSLLRSLGLEWVWRLMLEPRRMFKRYIFGNPLFIGRAFRSRLQNLVFKRSQSPTRRIVDLFVSGAALVLFSPIFLLIALAIKADSRGPVFFKQIRVGELGKPFLIYKFRTMHEDAEQRRSALLHRSKRAGICFKDRNDPRVTRAGRILRRFSLDELPQIVNIWRGDMAVVGPRPALLQEVAAYPTKALGRLLAKPGLTGVWQVSGRAEISFDRMINMDLASVKLQTAFADLAVIFLTFRAVITGRGAY